MALRNIGEIAFQPSQLGIVRYSSRVTVERVLADYPGVYAVMAAPMYGATGSTPCGGGINPCTRQFDKLTGVNVGPASRFVDRGVIFNIVGGRASAKIGSALDPSASVAIQTYPILLWSGQAGGGGSESSVAGLGLWPDGSLRYIVASGGTLTQLGALFKERGAVSAGYCDAGSSAALYVRGEGWRGVHAQAPKLPAWIVVRNGGGSSRKLSTGAKAAIAVATILGAVIVWNAVRG